MLDWTEQQRAIIEAAANCRMVVEAGPGTGKTAVACARVAHLLRNGVNPSNIFMVSFTRTAVQEMRDRIASMADMEAAGSVQITTLDSASFQLGVGIGRYRDGPPVSYEANISQAIQAFEEKDDNLMEYYCNIQHLLLDEAQDLTGDRSKLANLMLERLSDGAGATVFADPEQAIYGFTNDLEEAGEEEKARFLDILRKGSFEWRELSQLHRTEDRQLRDLFEKTRTALQDELLYDNEIARLRGVVETIKRSSHSLDGELSEAALTDGDLVLFRRRVDALMAAQFHNGPFRLRLPGYPPAIHPWLALAFGNHLEPTITEEGFKDLWEQQCPQSLTPGWTKDRAWNLLVSYAPGRRGLVNLEQLRDTLARPRPPVAFCSPDLGEHGPIFSTIHASKGREADRVLLMIPPIPRSSRNGADNIEEARVYYVGATRAKRVLIHGKGKRPRPVTNIGGHGGRLLELPMTVHDKMKLQFGLAGDLDDLAPLALDPQFCHSAQAAADHQWSLARLWHDRVRGIGTGADLIGRLNMVHVDGQSSYNYRLMQGDRLIGWTSMQFRRSVFRAMDAAKRTLHEHRQLYPPSLLPYFRMTGLRTTVIRPNSEEAARIHEPYASSGFILTPIITSYLMFKLRAR